MDKFSENKTGSVHVMYIEGRSHNHCYSKEVIDKYSAYVSLPLVIRHAKSMQRIIMSSVACLSLPHFFPHFVLNGTVFGGKNY